MNKYLSKYSQYQTHFHRTDPWKYHNIPYDFEIEKSNVSLIKDLAFFAFCMAVLAFVWHLAWV